MVSAPGSLIARGNGRSYGDSSLNPGGVLLTHRLDRLLSLSTDGVVTCEAGTLLSDIIKTFLPRGWFPSVTPGTKLVSIGGMIASDVHGKNHHGAGSFCDYLLSIDLALADGRVVTCSHTENAELFAATCGGMGLTGVILRATFKLMAVESSKIRQHTIRASCLEETLAQLERLQDATYCVAWIDCLANVPNLGRSVIFVGEHATVDDLPQECRGAPFARVPRRSRTMPINLPGFVLSRPSMRAFNALYYHSHRPRSALVDIDPYFYPLDAVHDWNRMYGRRGFVQYQPVFPLTEREEGLRRLLSEIAAAGQASFLAVLKRMGPQSFGLMSFPLAGYTVTLDFPATLENLAFLDRLDAIVADYGGRIYLAKDARMTASMLAAGYPRLSQFREIRHRLGLVNRFTSLQSDRLDL